MWAHDKDGGSTTTIATQYVWLVPHLQINTVIIFWRWWAKASYILPLNLPSFVCMIDTRPQNLPPWRIHLVGPYPLLLIFHVLLLYVTENDAKISLKQIRIHFCSIIISTFTSAFAHKSWISKCWIWICFFFYNRWCLIFILDIFIGISLRLNMFFNF